MAGDGGGSGGVSDMGPPVIAVTNRSLIFNWLVFPPSTRPGPLRCRPMAGIPRPLPGEPRSEEHTSELQSRRDLVCCLLLEKKNQNVCVGAAQELDQDGDQGRDPTRPRP